MSRDRGCVEIEIVPAFSGASDWLCFRIYACDADLGRGYDNEGGVQDVSGSGLITITTHTFVLHPPSLPRRGSADSRWTDRNNAGHRHNRRCLSSVRKWRQNVQNATRRCTSVSVLQVMFEMEQTLNYLSAACRLCKLVFI